MLWLVLGKVRIEMERGLKNEFSSRSGFSFTYHILVFCSFLNSYFIQRDDHSLDHT